TGAQACTSVLALNEVLQATGIRRLGLVTPYRSDVQAVIVRNYATIGIDCVAERHLRLQDNFAFSDVGADDIRRMVREVMSDSGDQRPEAVTILCTNLRGAPLVTEL